MADLRTLLGRRVRKLRKQKGWTQEELGEFSNISYKFLGSVERGQENPSIDFVSKIADALEVSMRDLFDFEHELASEGELRDQINALLDEADLEELQTISQVVRSILR